MTKTLILISALIGGIALPSVTLADTVFGCEVVDKGGYLNKVDPTCAFDVISGSGAEIDPEDLADLLADL